MPFATFPKRRGDMFVAVCTTPKASPIPRRPHQTWSFLSSPNSSTPPPEELLDEFLHASPLTDPFSDDHCSEEPSSEPPTPSPLNLSFEQPYLEAPHFDKPFSLDDAATCPYPTSPSSASDVFAIPLPYPQGPLHLSTTTLPPSPLDSAPPSPLDSAPPSPLTPTSSERLAIINLTPHSLRLAARLSHHFPTLLYSSHASHIAAAAQTYAHAHPLVTFTSSPALLASATHFLVCLPAAAPGSGNCSGVAAALRQVAAYAQPGATVVLECGAEGGASVGTTRGLLANLHRYQGLLCGVVVAPAAAAHRSPADEEAEEPRVVAGLCHSSLASVVSLYSRVYSSLLTVSQPEVAERMGVRGKGLGSGCSVMMAMGEGCGSEAYEEEMLLRC
ncbi:hypothetical protein B0J12DRAFT_227581 [Macrophomina phaseolina]|uniref:Uncharacterized protein n=1 Tax=Macrophomina phaseolina TaxID=35725 RepID=A0ABQ8GSS0_9PEZI|nr:hypothetical protein B0J12DRAFT_227581 [Macrophomina phaseolina]